MRYTLLLLIPAALLLYIRVAPMSVARWHVDPLQAERPTTPNAYLLRDADGDAPALRLAAPPDRVAEALDQMIAASPRVQRLAGSPQEGLVTYVQRSRLMGYPDAISIRVSPDGDGTQVAVFSRSRFGYGDAGVNAARVTRWMDRLQSMLSP